MVLGLSLSLRLGMLVLCLGIGAMITYTCINTGSPFHKEYLYQPWMTATLYDFYTNVAVLLCWIWYKEQGFISRAFWSFMLVGLGSFGTTLYVLVQLAKIPMRDPKIMEKLLLRKHPVLETFQNPYSPMMR